MITVPKMDQPINKKAKFVQKYQKGLSSNWKKLQNELTEKSKQLSIEDQNKPRKNRKKLTKNPEIKTQNTKSNDAKNGSAQENRKKLTKNPKIKIPNNKSNSAKNGSTEVWFDDVDPCMIKTAKKSQSSSISKEKPFAELTKYVAMDCEMVGCGFNGSHSVLARCSIVNIFGECVYDKFVKPLEKVTDYRTKYSGIRHKDLINGEDFKKVQLEVYEIIKDRILVGHSIENDLKVLYLSHPRKDIRDTSVFFKKYTKCHGKPSLRFLSEQYLGIKIQEGEHNSIIDARATMALFTLFNKNWQKTIL